MPIEEGHWLPRNHLEVLDGHPDRNKTSIIRRYYYPLLWGVTGLFGTVFCQLAMRKPILSGIQIQAAFLTTCTVGGEFYGRMKEKYYKEDEARLRYYVQTHPEHFPDYEFIKIGDILEPWIPVR